MSTHHKTSHIWPEETKYTHSMEYLVNYFLIFISLPLKTNVKFTLFNDCVKFGEKIIVELSNFCLT